MGSSLALMATMLLLPAGSASAQPTQDEARVVVHTGGVREASDGVSALSGVELVLFDDGDGETPRTEDWASCTADGQGECVFTVPIGDDGVPADTRLWVGQSADGAPDGWYTNTELRTGHGDGSDSVRRPYRYQTPGLEGGQSYDSAEDFMNTGGLGNARSGGVWQNSLDNPALPDVCGLNAALLLDLSGSVGDELEDLIGAADVMVDSLVGTPSRMAVFSFGTDSPADLGGNHPALAPVATQAEADQVKQLYAGWGSQGGTNWDVAAQTVAEEMEAAGEHYDLTVMITDGNPTFYRDQQGNGSITRVVEVENGVFSANELKQKGSRLMVAGVGDGIDGTTGLNLRAMSGPVGFDPAAGGIAHADHLHVDDFAEVGQAIRDLLEELCSGSLSVTKYIVPTENEGDDITGAVQAGEGWTFDAEVLTPDGVSVDPESATTDDTGTVNFSLGFDSADESTTLQVTERQQDGYALVTPDGQTATCYVRETRDEHGTGPGPEPGYGATGDPAFTVEVPAQAAVVCEIYNKRVPGQPHELTVDKEWVIDGRIVAHGDRPDGFEAGLELSGPDGTDPSPQDWGGARPGYSKGEEATGSEDIAVPDRCTLDAVRMARGDDPENPVPVDPTALNFEAYARSSEYLITNEVSCDTRLTLVKTVDNTGGGDAAPDDWVLTADGPTVLVGRSGDEEVTDVWIRPGFYEITEHGPDDYDFHSWMCLADENPNPINDGYEVDIDFGQHVTCTVHNVSQKPDPSPSPSPSPSPDPTPTPEPPPTPEPNPTDGPKLPVTGASVGGIVGGSALLALVGLGLLALAWRGRLFRGA